MDRSIYGLTELMPTLPSEVYALSPFAIPVALTAILIAAFGARVVARRATAVSGAFLSITIAVAIWLLAFAGMYCSKDAHLALVWARAAYLGIPFIAPAVYWFTIEILRIEQRRRLALMTAWSGAAFFSAVAVTTDRLVVSVQTFWWGFYPRYGTRVAAAFLIFFFSYLIASLAEFLRAYPSAHGAEQKRIRALLIAFGIAYLGSVDFLPKYGIAAYPFGYLGILGFVFVVSRTIRRYDLVPLTPSLAAQEIISTMADVLFVCDSEGRIEVANRAAVTLLGYAESELLGKRIDDLLGQEGDISSKLRRRSLRNAEYVFASKTGERIELTLSIAPVLHDDVPAGAVIIGRDVRDHKRAEAARLAAEAALRESEIRYRLLFEQNAAGVCVNRLDGSIVDCNSTFGSMLGYPREDLVGRNAAEIYANPAEADELIALLRSAGTLNSVEIELRRADGSALWVIENLVLVGDTQTGVVHATVVDISDRKRAEEQIEFHAYHDVLTHLPNRKLFTDRLRHGLTRARRSGKAVAVLFVDIDHFKTINDTLGHTAGDQLLLEVAHRLRLCVREDDTVARLGGDEFTVILGDLRYPEDAVTVAEKILEGVQPPLTIAGTPIVATVSIGIAIYPDDGTDPESLLRNADSAMYRAKEAGRNTYQLCTDEMKHRAVERLAVESRLRSAIQESQLILAYQPQINLVTGRTIGVEALVRWNDPERGIVAPLSFIPIAEETRLIVPLGEWVLRTACLQTKQWQDRGAGPIRVAVNLSARQFQQHDLVEMVRSVLDESGLSASSLELEITETTAMQNAEITVEILRALREIGVGISIDDFGMGYSSLNYLKRFPISAVKIDRAFVGDLIADDGDAAIVSAVIGMARSLRLRVVAEGVETAEQFAFLRSRECDEAQGFYFSRPIPAEEATRALLGRHTFSVREPRISV
jgi:diguanylate cyclase (GGDEF)-like protein/PAS domain S-box-containing protein